MGGKGLCSYSFGRSRTALIDSLVVLNASNDRLPEMQGKFSIHDDTIENGADVQDEPDTRRRDGGHVPKMQHHIQTRRIRPVLG